MRDLLDAPSRCAENDRLPRPAFEDHLFIELADASAFFGTCKKYAVEATIGDGAAVGDGHSLCTLARGQLVLHAVPGDARTQLGEFVGGIAAGEHIQYAI